MVTLAGVRRERSRKWNGWTERETELVNWCVEPSQPRGIISGLKETFIKSYRVEMTNTTEIRPREQSEITESCRENLWNEIQLKGQ